MPAWKIGSGEFRSSDLVAAMMATGKASSVEHRHVELVSKSLRPSTAFADAGCDFALFQCTSRYPTPLDRLV